MRRLVVAIAFALIATADARALEYGPDTPTKLGLHVFGAAGRNSGWGLGLGISYAWLPATGVGIELVGNIYHNEYVEDSQTSSGGEVYDVEDDVDLNLVTAMVNALFAYRADKGRPFFILGGGFAFADVRWMQTTDDGIAYGGIVNLGIGYNPLSWFELQVSAPVVLFFNDIGEVDNFYPALVVGVVFRR